ncbi:MAG: exodeoxyribonuclease VII large subunit [Chitinophagaceae bacterium]|nr:MAG: exodeoxyribonuclease VII large subunit [Chitinophagaceae bacterium]
MPETIQDKKVFSLLEVARSIQKTLTDRYTSTFWIKADMNKLNLYAQSGHCFPELLEKKDGRVITEMKALLWRDDYTRVNNQFLEVLGEPLRDGITILFTARITFDPVYGLTLRIVDIDPWYSLGELEKEKQLAIAKLQQEGLFHKNKTVPFPLLPKRIAIISVESSKGYSDFMKIMNGNAWDYKFFSMLFPAFLQGDKAVSSILYQLKQINKVKHHFDVVAIIRGGGGDVGLTCYNDYELSKAIAMYALPVLTGIGHSTNETVAEMVAFKNAITPTELADFLLQKYHDFTVPLQEAEDKLIDHTRLLLKDERSSLLNLAKHLKSSSRALLSDSKNAVNFVSRSLIADSGNFVLNQKSGLRQLSKDLVSNSRMVFSKERNQLGERTTRLQETSKFLLLNAMRDLNNTEKLVHILSPQQVLKRGYSITMVNGRLAKSVDDIKTGDLLSTTIADGVITAVVESKNKISDEQ